jgi:N-hydroxyarylamine O-acetyltransferase
MTLTAEQMDAYRARIGFDGPLRADVATLEALQRAHRYAIPFENLDIPLGRGIALAQDALLDKLVARRRGGYCFEQNALFLAVLRTIGFEARPLLARVWLAADGTPPRSHTLNLVRLDGADLVSDVGFGGDYAPVLPLAEAGPVATEDGVRHRLRPDSEHGRMLERDAGSGWTRQYSFTLDPVWPADLEQANHFTATRPGTRFTTLRLVSQARPGGYASLIGRTLTVSGEGRSEVREIAGPADYRATLADAFGLALDGDEVAALGLF